MSTYNLVEETLSSKLSEVMDDIGVNEYVIFKRRRSFVLMEGIDTVSHTITGKFVATYNIGSQSEGSTTLNLDSDIDSLFVYKHLNIVRDWNEVEQSTRELPYTQNALMIQNENTSPGHCFLQFENPKIILPVQMIELGKRHFIKDRKGRFLLKNTCFDDFVKHIYNSKNGPAHTLEGDDRYNDEDNVAAWHCKYWPEEAQQWLVKTDIDGWPSEDLKKECEATGCIIVPVGSKESQYEELEWRISTCLAERCLMFSLNATQMRCYVLMKMIRKTYLQAKFPGVRFSSYICKTVLFHCIHSSKSNEWRESNLLWCLKKCLVNIETCIMNLSCSHFFIPGNNLLKGKIPLSKKQELATYIRSMIQSIEYLPLGISLDRLNVRFFAKLFPEHGHIFRYNFQSAFSVSSLISGKLLNHIAIQLDNQYRFLLYFINNCDSQIQNTQNLLKILKDIIASYANNTKLYVACKLIEPFFCSSLASMYASNDISAMKSVETLDLFAKGSYSDVSSGKLMYASALFCFGEINKTYVLLQEIESMYDGTVQNICSCNEHKSADMKMEFCMKAYEDNEELIKNITSFCVKFLPCEINCVPHELRYEMFRRSIAEDKSYGNEFNDFWMNLAVVDSLPFLYFLQYKTYARLKMAEKQKTTLLKFEILVNIQAELGFGHQETALNLLGQCMEEENRFNDALHMYIRSLKVRSRDNVAKIHICKLISALCSKCFRG